MASDGSVTRARLPAGLLRRFFGFLFPITQSARAGVKCNTVAN